MHVHGSTLLIGVAFDEFSLAGLQWSTDVVNKPDGIRTGNNGGRFHADLTIIDDSN